LEGRGHAPRWSPARPRQEGSGPSGRGSCRGPGRGRWGAKGGVRGELAARHDNGKALRTASPLGPRCRRCISSSVSPQPSRESPERVFRLRGGRGRNLRVRGPEYAREGNKWGILIQGWIVDSPPGPQRGGTQGRGPRDDRGKGAVSWSRAAVAASKHAPDGGGPGRPCRQFSWSGQRFSPCVFARGGLSRGLNVGCRPHRSRLTKESGATDGDGGGRRPHGDEGEDQRRAFYRQRRTSPDTPAVKGRRGQDIGLWARSPKRPPAIGVDSRLEHNSPPLISGRARRRSYGAAGHFVRDPPGEKNSGGIDRPTTFKPRRERRQRQSPTRSEPGRPGTAPTP